MWWIMCCLASFIHLELQVYAVKYVVSFNIMCFFKHCIHTMSSVAKYMSKASDENVRNLKATVETFGFHLVGRPTAA